MSQFVLPFEPRASQDAQGEVLGHVEVALRCGWDRPLQSFWSDVKVDVTPASDDPLEVPALEWEIAPFYYAVGVAGREEPAEKWVSRVDSLVRGSVNRFYLLRAFMGAPLSSRPSAKLGGANGLVWRAGSSARGPVNLTPNERDMVSRPELRPALPRLEEAFTDAVDRRVREMVRLSVESFEGLQSLEATSVYGEV